MFDKEPQTLDNIEEDLVLNYDEEKIINPEKKSELFRNASTDVLTKYGRYIDKDIVDRVFPGIDLNSINEYDFNNSRVKLFVLDDATYDELFYGKFGENPKNVTGVFARGQNYGHKDSLSFLEPDIRSELAGNIFVRQRGDHYDSLESTIRHEVLHALRVGQGGLDDFLTEGMVTYLAYKSGPNIKKRDDDLNEKINNEPKKKLKLSGVVQAAKDLWDEDYTLQASVFFVLHKICTHNEAWTEEQFLESLINKNSLQRKELANVMIRNADREIIDYFKLISEFYKE